MRKFISFGVAAMAVCLAVSPLLADTARCTLEQMKINDSTNAVGGLAFRRVEAEVGRPAALKAPPKKTSTTTAYFCVRVGQVDLLMALDYSQSGSKLYIDTDRDGSLSNERPLVASKSGGKKQVFPAIPIEGRGGAKIIAKFEVAGPKALLIYPGAMYGGSIELEGKPYQVFVADGNLDGTYDGCFAGQIVGGSHDVLAIDMDGNRRVDGNVDGCAESMPLPRVVQVNGGYYSVKVGADGKSIEMEKAEAETGTLQVDTRYANLVLWSTNGAYHFGGKSKCELPVGTYYPARVFLVKKDGGATWTLEGSPGGKLTVFDIKAGQTTALEIGTPLVGKVDFRREGQPRTLSLGFRLLGRAGEEYEPRAYRNQSKVPLPQFKIVDESGKRLAQGGFSSFGFG